MSLLIFMISRMYFTNGFTNFIFDGICNYPHSQRCAPLALRAFQGFQKLQGDQKHLKSTHLIIPSSLCFLNFAQKSIPGVVRAQVLQVPVGASHADQVRKSGMPHPFSDPGGQEESPGTPHLTLASLCRNPQGGGRWCII